MSVDNPEDDAAQLQAALSELHSSFTLSVFRIAILMNEAMSDAAQRRSTAELLKRVADFGAQLGFETTKSEDDDKGESATIELLEHERSKGFPLHRGLTVIGLWSYLEAYVDDVTAECLFWQPKFLDETHLMKVKGPLLEFTRLRLSERARHLLERLSSESTTRPGVDRHEEVLTKLGLADGRVDAHLRRLLLEFYAVRNLFAHRGGVVDKRFCLACPQFDIPEGQELLLTQRMVLGYMVAAIRYGTIVVKRILDRLGVADESVDGYFARTADIATEYARSIETPGKKLKAPRKRKAGRGK